MVAPDLNGFWYFRSVGGARIRAVWALCYVVLAVGSSATADTDDKVLQEQVLYNGIRLQSPWPPRLTSTRVESPPQPPYLVSPPSVIPINVGRQLFVDDFLIESTTMKRSYSRVTYHWENPILRPDKPWERRPRPQSAACAIPYSGGVWYDPADATFKMWYMGGYMGATCYATSQDGVRWEKSLLDIEPGTNIILKPLPRDSTTFWLDLTDNDAARRFKALIFSEMPERRGLALRFSSDGIHWSAPVAYSKNIGDRTTFFYNPFRKVWVYSLRVGRGKYGRPRTRVYREHRDVVDGINWQEDNGLYEQHTDLFPWIGARRLDPEFPRPMDPNSPPQLYNLDAIAYESVMLGLFTMWRGQPKGRPKLNEIVLGFSRDGFHWTMPTRRAFITYSQRRGDWNWGNVQSAGGGCLIVGNKLYFYFSGRAGVPGTDHSGVCSTGLAMLRRDGFVSMRAEEDEQTLTTRPIRFKGKYLFVNSAAPKGELRVEVLDKRGQVIAPFSRTACKPLRGDATIQAVTWEAASHLGHLAGQPVKFRFFLRSGHLYAFWVSPSESGVSHGYVAAGGPGYTGPTDTVGRAALVGG